MGHLTLDVAFPQILLNVPADANGYTEHHRLLLHKLSPGRWVACSPDFDLEILDLNNRVHTVLGRRSRFPDHLADVVYAFDPISRSDLENLRRQAKTMAMVLGDETQEEVQSLQWVYSDPMSDRLGRVVDQVLLDDAVFLGSKGLVEVDGEVEEIREIPQADLAGYAEARKGSLGDVRTLGKHEDPHGRRFLSFQDAFIIMKEEKFADWGFQGPRAAKEFLTSLRESGADLTTYHLQWLKNSGVAQKTSVAHEHKTLVEVIRLAVCRDQLNPLNLMSMELVVRRLVQLEIAVSRSPSAPEFAGLDLLMENPVTEGGAATTRALDQWLTEQLKAKAQIQKQTRLYKEEVGYGHRDRGGLEGGEGSGGGWRSRKKANAKAKAKAGAGSGGAGAGDT
jgi:hypothetical protein